MKNILISLGILVVVTVIGIWAYGIRNRPEEEAKELNGFRDWVKNPEFKKEAADYFAARDSLSVPDDISDDEIQEMVDRLIVPQNEDFNFERLELVGVKAIPILIAELEDPKTAKTKFGKGGHALAPKSPFERIVDLLEPLGPAEAAVPLSKYMDHEDEHFRKYAAIAIGNIGNTDCIEPMLKALGDDEDYVRSFAMMGIKRGMKAGRCTADFLEAMIPALIKLLNRRDQSIGGEAPELLLAIDADRTLPTLLSSKYFSIENREVHYIIRAMNESGHKIPHEILLPFMKKVKPLVDKYPHNYEYAAALIAYANHPDENAETIFREELKSSNDRVQEAAAEALGIAAGITNAREFLFDAIESVGFERLSQPQKQYYAVFLYDAEVNNGGHSQYFVNSSGNNWKYAMAGLTAIGAKQRAAILEKATSLFGSTGPSSDNDARHQKLASFDVQQDKTLSELDSQYYACEESVEALLALFAIKHKSHFSSQK